MEGKMGSSKRGKNPGRVPFQHASWMPCFLPIQKTPKQGKPPTPAAAFRSGLDP